MAFFWTQKLPNVRSILKIWFNLRDILNRQYKNTTVSEVWIGTHLEVYFLRMIAGMLSILCLIFIIQENFENLILNVILDRLKVHSDWGYSEICWWVYGIVYSKEFCTTLKNRNYNDKKTKNSVGSNIYQIDSNLMFQILCQWQSKEVLLLLLIKWLWNINLWYKSIICMKNTIHTKYFHNTTVKYIWKILK